MANCTVCGFDTGISRFCSSCGASVIVENQIDEALTASPSSSSPLPELELAPELPAPVFNSPNVNPAPVNQAPTVYQAPQAYQAPNTNSAYNSSNSSGNAYGNSSGSNEEAPNPNGVYAALGIGAYIGMIALFTLPFIGWIFALIMSFVPKNINRKNFARAALIFMVIILVLSFVASALISFAISQLFNAIGSLAGGALNGYVSEIFSLDQLGEIAEAIGDMSEQFSEIAEIGEQFGEIGEGIGEAVSDFGGVGEAVPELSEAAS